MCPEYRRLRGRNELVKMLGTQELHYKNVVVSDIQQQNKISNTFSSGLEGREIGDFGNPCLPTFRALYRHPVSGIF